MIYSHRYIKSRGICMDKQIKQEVADKAFNNRWYLFSILLFCTGSFLIGLFVNNLNPAFITAGTILIVLGIMLNWGVIDNIQSALGILVKANNEEEDNDMDILNEKNNK